MQSDSRINNVGKNNPADATQIQQDIYKNPELNTEVILYTIHGSGHTWPSRNGGSERVLGNLIGNRCLSGYLGIF